MHCSRGAGQVGVTSTARVTRRCRRTQHRGVGARLATLGYGVLFDWALLKDRAGSGDRETLGTRFLGVRRRRGPWGSGRPRICGLQAGRSSPIPWNHMVESGRSLPSAVAGPGRWCNWEAPPRPRHMERGRLNGMLSGQLGKHRKHMAPAIAVTWILGGWRVGII